MKTFFAGYSCTCILYGSYFQALKITVNANQDLHVFLFVSITTHDITQIFPWNSPCSFEM